MNILFAQVDDFEALFSCNNGQHSVLLKNFLAKRITIESMVILDGLLSYVKKWDKELEDDLVWPDVRRLVVKYSAFLSYDIHKCRLQLLKTVKENF
jgi:hypothetical protein